MGLRDQDQQIMRDRLAKLITRGVMIAGLVIFLIIFFSKMWFTQGAGEIVIVQAPVSGELTMYTSAGVHTQGFGSITRYKKSFQFWFSKMKDQGDNKDQSIKVRFSDGGHAQISGSCRIDLPVDAPSMISLHTKYGSQKAIEDALVRTVIEKSVYMVGPLMTSRESYAEKRNDLISYISDQAERGVFKTAQRETKQKDPLTNEEKTVTIVEIQKDASGNFATEEVSPLKLYHLKFSNLSINSIDYEATVEDQIKQQQKLVMQVQTAIATSKKAEQDALTAQKEGEANATKEKWAQEAIKAKEVTKAEQELAVQDLNTKKAALYKQEQTLIGEGDGARKRAVFQADGALEQKLATYEKIMTVAYTEMAKQKWVPEWVMDGSGNGNASNGGSQMNTFMNMMNANAMQQLGLNMNNISGGSGAPAGPVKKKK